MDDLNALYRAPTLELRTYIVHAWNGLGFYGRFALNKLMTGTFRFRIAQRILLFALSHLTKKEPASLAHRIVGNWNPAKVTMRELLLSKNKNDQLSIPYPFISPLSFEGIFEDLGSPDEWIIEKKWEGKKVQLIKRENQIFLWSSKEELITQNFPEFLSLVDILPNSCVLEGKILVWNKGQLGSLEDLDKRDKSLNPSKKTQNDLPVIMIVYDILELEGKDIRDKVTSTRRSILKQLILSIADKSQLLLLSERIRPDNWDELISMRSRMRKILVDGVVLKHQSATHPSLHLANRWWKWKANPFSLLGVLIYASGDTWGASSKYSEFTFAVWKGNELVPVVKTRSNLSVEESDEISKWIKNNTIERFGPVRSVKPELIFEIEFETISESKRRKSGISLRNPKIRKWLKNNAVSDANTLMDLTSILENERYGKLE
jgi:DNA ligase-1